MLSDRFGRKPLLLFFGLGFALLSVPLLRSLGSSFASLLLVQCAGMVLLTGFTSISAAVNAEVFPARVRAAGIGFPYSLTVAVFGGTAPYVGTLFKETGHAGLFPGTSPCSASCRPWCICGCRRARTRSSTADARCTECNRGCASCQLTGHAAG